MSNILESTEILKICISLKSPGNYFSKVTAYKWPFAFPKSSRTNFIESVEAAFHPFPVVQHFIKLFFNAPWLCLSWIYIIQPYPLSLIKFVCPSFEHFFLFCSQKRKRVGKNQGTLIHLWNCPSMITWILILGEIVTFPRWACQICDGEPST